MKNIILIAIAICTVIVGCSKKNEQLSCKAPRVDSTTNVLPQDTTKNIMLLDEDEDKPIVIGTVRHISGYPIVGALVTYSNGGNPIQGTTNILGQYTFHLPVLGNWSIDIVKSGYACYQTQVNFVDSMTLRIDTLSEGLCP